MSVRILNNGHLSYVGRANNGRDGLRRPKHIQHRTVCSRLDSGLVIKQKEIKNLKSRFEWEPRCPWVGQKQESMAVLSVAKVFLNAISVKCLDWDTVGSENV